MRHYDVAIVGGGIVGLATARTLLERRPSLRLAVLEKESALGQHQTGHNSGVIHSGLYYAPGSKKAEFCVSGGRALYAYCVEHNIPVERCGKVIVATDARERAGLDRLLERGTANGVVGLEIIGPERLRELEPHCVGQAALWSPNTGIVDFSRVTFSYAQDVASLGGDLLTDCEVTAVRRGDREVLLETRAETVAASHLIACGGLQADRLARLCGAPPDPEIVPFRGDYWVLRPERRFLVRNLIYPVPDPAFPFLGVHFTRRITDGSIWLGPNAVLAFAREGYRRSDVDLGDLRQALGFPGFQRLARRYWKTGALELWRDWSKRAFVEALQRYVPALQPQDVVPGPAGVRAQALSATGELVDDFVVQSQDGRIVHVRNAPSPAATSSLAIGLAVADMAERTFDLG